MHRRSRGVVPVALSGLVGAATLVTSAPTAAPASAQALTGTPGMMIKVSPNHGLRSGQTVIVTGRGLPRSAGTSSRTWFVTECTAAVRGRVDPDTDTPHCAISDAQALKVSSTGTFTARYRLTAGIIGDGYCGTAGHATCVIGVGTAQGLGTVTRIAFKVPPSTSPPSTSPPAGTTSGGVATTTTTRPR